MKKMMMVAVLALFALATAQAGKLDTKASTLKWKGSKGAAGFKLGSHYGKISFKDGSIEEKDGKLTGGEFTVDMEKFTVDDLSGEWANKFIGHMKSADFFKVDKYPTSSLKIKNVKNNKVTADLTINGKTNEVAFDYKKSGNQYLGKLVFDRTKFDMHYGEDESLGDKFIHHDVELEFAITSK